MQLVYVKQCKHSKQERWNKPKSYYKSWVERKYTQKVGKKSASKLYKNSIENIFQKDG